MDGYGGKDFEKRKFLRREWRNSFRYSQTFEMKYLKMATKTKQRRTELDKMITCCNTSNVTSVTEVRSASARLFAGTWRPLLSVITTLYYVAIKKFG